MNREPEWLSFTRTEPRDRRRRLVFALVAAPLLLGIGFVSVFLAALVSRVAASVFPAALVGPVIPVAAGVADGMEALGRAIEALARSLTLLVGLLTLAIILAPIVALVALDDPWRALIWLIRLLALRHLGPA